MLFNSYVFIFGFFPVSLIGFYLLARFFGPSPAKLWLGLVSVVFYGWWNPAFVALLLCSVGGNFLISRFICRHADNTRLQTRFLWLGIGLNLLPLIFFKYFFAMVMFSHKVGLLPFDLSNMILPLGISFFTFTQIGYLVDCQQGLVKESRFIDYLLFVTFFPHLIAGPILHNREIMPQFADEKTYRFNPQNLSVGLTLFVMGLFKKVILADNIAPCADAGFAHVGSLTQIDAVTTVMAYSMQLYFDFSGYSDMAIGLAAMFGVRFPLNFNSPYKARSIIDFWARWHMTLTRYLTLLVYNPVSLWMTRRRIARGVPANKKAMATFGGFVSMIAFPIFLTMLVSGIWHGAGFQFIVFGLLHAIYLTINHAWKIFRPKAADKTGVADFVDGVWKVALTYLAVVLAQIFFRASSVHDAVTIIKAVAGAHGSGLPLVVHFGMTAHNPVLNLLARLHIVSEGPIYTYGLVTKILVINLMLIGLAYLIVWATPNAAQILGAYSPALQNPEKMKYGWLSWRPNLVWAAIIAVLFFYAYTQLGHPSRFLYFQF